MYFLDGLLILCMLYLLICSSYVHVFFICTMVLS